MKKKIFIILQVVAVIFIGQRAFSQEFMINGDFEYVDGTIPKLPPYPPNSGPIYLAPPWDNITGTCDVHHNSQSPFVIGTPRNGAGCGRFVAPQFGSAGSNEYGYGVTNPLTAGVTYVVSFWIRKDFPSERDVPVGVIISESIPQIQTSPFNSSHTPNMKITPINTQYVKGSFCFTAQNSVTHYVSFGPWTGLGEETVGFYIDDVSVSPFPQGTPMSSADLSMPTTYCVTDQVIADGSGSIGNDGYVWEIYNYTNGFAQLSYSSGQQSGQPGTLDVSAIIGNGSPGACYDVKLTMLGVCQSETTVNFCFVNPNIDFIGAGSAVCENTPVDLTVTGDNGWTYAWSSGQSGVGLKTVTVTPTQGNSTYSVTVTTPEGCTHTETVTLTVHSSNNLAPWMNGINGSGEYTAYVQQGGSVYFWSYLFNDNGSELITTEDDFNNLPPLSTYLYNPPSTSSGVWDFNVNTSSSTPVGSYSFNLTSNDNNVCAEGISTFTFTIIVICDQCPVCISYEDRTPTNNPLPPETKVGDCINAGFTNPVETGQQSVLFQAGNTIDLGNSFSAGSGFQAVIEPSTCVTDCEDCCNDWTGFTYDPVQNYVNFDDGNPASDIWQLTDINHPFCAFGAKGYELIIDSRWNNPANADGDIYYNSWNASWCCPFESPATENPIANSDIWWDGYTTNIFGNPVHPNDGTYFYKVTLYGCDGQTQVISGFFTILSSSNAPLAPSGNYEVSQELSPIELEIAAFRNAEHSLKLLPNPTTDLLHIEGLESDQKVQVVILDEGGKVVLNTTVENGILDVSALSNGSYFAQFYLKNSYITKKFIKQ